MKLLIAFNRDSNKNPYVKTLADGLAAQGVDVTCSVSEFWNNAIAYDIIHVMWPNILVDKNDPACTKLQSVIAGIHKTRKILVSTCHNIHPHYDSGVAINNAYRIIYEECDFIHHLGKASINLLQQTYPNVKAESIVIPHHTYDTLYDLRIDKQFARVQLGIPKDARVVLSFGAFRHDEERKLMTDISDNMGEEYYFLAPSFCPPSPILRKNIFKGFQALCNILKYYTIAHKHNLHIRHSYVPDDMLPLYLVSADVLFIQRIKILNSGNVSLAMMAGLPIVGPDVGNVGEMLKKTGNRVFDPQKTDEIPMLIKDALSDHKTPSKNHIYAQDYLSTSSVSRMFKDFYQRIMESHLLEHTGL